MHNSLRISLVALVFSAAAFSQNFDTQYQVSLVTGLDTGSVVLNFSNSGANSTTAFPTQNGSICANVYILSPASQLLACCAVAVAPDGLVSADVARNLLTTSTGGVPSSVIVKVIGSSASPGSAPSGNTSACNPSSVNSPLNQLSPGLLAWSSSQTANGTGPAAVKSFSPSILSAAELVRLTESCVANMGNTPFGVCKGFQLGGR